MLKDFPLNQEKDMGSTINIHIWHFTENSSQFSKTRKKKQKNEKMNPVYLLEDEGSHREVPAPR